MHGATTAVDLIDQVSKENARLTDSETTVRQAIGEEKEKRELAESQAAVERARTAIIEAELASERDHAKDLNEEISRLNAEVAKAVGLLKEADKRMGAAKKERLDLEAARKIDQDAVASAEAKILAANERADKAEAKALEANEKADKAVAVYKSSENYLEELEEASSEAFAMGFGGCLFLVRNKFPQLDVSEIRIRDVPDDFTVDGYEVGPSAAAETGAGTDK